MWPSGLSTWTPCAVESGTLSGLGANLSPDVSAYQRIVLNNFYAHSEQGHGDNPGQE